MKIIDWKVLKNLVPYSRQHIARLEAAGTFPKRVFLGELQPKRVSKKTGKLYRPYCRVGWVNDEIEAWIRERMNARATAPK